MKINLNKKTIEVNNETIEDLLHIQHEIHINIRLFDNNITDLLQTNRQSDLTEAENRLKMLLDDGDLLENVTLSEPKVGKLNASRVVNADCNYPILESVLALHDLLKKDYSVICRNVYPRVYKCLLSDLVTDCDINDFFEYCSQHDLKSDYKDSL